MSGISSRAAGSLVNRKIYNGIEYDDDLDLDIYEAYFRTLDPQTGRWSQMDPKIEDDQESMSPYTSMANDPVKFSDPLGDVPGDGDGDPPGVIASAWHAVTGFFSEMGQRAQTNFAADVAWVKNTASTLASNAKANWASGNTIIQQIPRDALANPLSLIVPLSLRAEVTEVEVVQRAMSNAELQATKTTKLVRGGRDGPNFVSDALGNNANKVRQRAALPQTPEVKVTLEVPKGSFPKATKVKPNFNMPGGGMERVATGKIPAKILKVEILKKSK